IKSQQQPVPAIPHCKVIGEVFSTYFLAEIGDELLLIDKHAAHERMIYERLKAGQGAVQRQVLLEPLPLALSREEAAALLEHRDLLEQAGFLAEEFGAGALVLRECPLLLVGADLNAQMAEVAGGLLAQKGDLTTGALDWIFHSAACRAAVKAGDPTTPYERERFVEKLLAMPEIRHCPHGRPVMISLTKKELEKRFGRG
ncbi:MAG: DNA mismatch repair protein MutL, partial [Oscillospiraceae bacterium]|nr:DNA mismatch repair protein MutL [Oscillospiraceae bacterium]